MKKVFIRDYPNHAGRWIYDGFANAFEHKGYEVERWSKLSLDSTGEVLMITDSDINFMPKGKLIYQNLKKFEKLCESFKHVLMFVSPNSMPYPYGKHPNFVSLNSSNKSVVDFLNKIENLKKWTFCDFSKEDFWDDWGDLIYLPLAFDSIAYKEIEDPSYQYDVVYVGGWADNGFNTKKEIIKSYLGEFKDSGLKCGFFINKDITHEQECKLYTNSLCCLNIHDEYQQKFKLDTNERTWKTLGLNGILVSDDVGDALPNIANVYSVSNPQEMVSTVKWIVDGIEGFNRNTSKKYIRENETYINRVEKLLNE